MKKVKNIYALVLMGLALTACGSNQQSAVNEKEVAQTKEETAPAEAMESMPEGANIVKENLPIEEPETSGEKATNLPEFNGKDQDGNPYSMEDIKKNDATVINLWFTGCAACIDEMADLNNLADEIKKESNVDFISMCTDVNYDESTKEAYQRIIKDKNPSYKALAVENEGALKEYLDNIFAYPTTIVVDKNGKIIGDPIEGALASPEQKAKLQENIKKAIESSKAM